MSQIALVAATSAALGCHDGGLTIPTIQTGPTLGSSADAEGADYCQIEKVDPRLRDAKRVGDNLFRVEVRNFVKVFEVQRDEETCWAAAAAMVRRYHGDKIDQRQLAEMFAGGKDDKSVDVDRIARALAYEHEKEFAKLMFHNSAAPPPITEDAFVAAIHGNEPVLIGIRESSGDDMGHTLVACAVTFRKLRAPATSMTAPGTWGVVELEAIDPDPDASTPVRKLSGTELREKVRFSMTKRTAELAVRQSLTDARNTNIDIRRNR